MKMSDFRTLERNIKVLEAHKRVGRDDIKGVTVQVVFESGAQDAVPVQIFVGAGNPNFEAIMAIVRNQVGTAKVEAEGKVEELKGKLMPK